MSRIYSMDCDGESWLFNWIGFGRHATIHLLCPECGQWNKIDHQQYDGQVSIVCATAGCSFHETHHWSGTGYATDADATALIGIASRRHPA